MADDASCYVIKMNSPRIGGYSNAKQEQYSQYLRKLHEDFIETWNAKSPDNAKLVDFVKQKVLGTGAFGVVYLAKHIATGRYYAMKVLEKEKIVKLKQIEHSYYEKKILSALNFPFCVYMKYFFKDNVYLYYILPFIPGGEMFSHLRKLDTTKRFGNLKNGVLDFKNHKWFRNIDWDSLLNCRIPAPFQPKIRSSGDTSNFESFDDEKIKESLVCLYEEEFADF
ncbi:cAMP-dependent protein kinase catalytic subunit beta-like [Maniola jurtina]|uniref:cAMP-dependent protein kinase catalytic subunit beta-like n=1 Tax=Maniola jurtina TaxID=191418 RepID=UPI001E68CC61|nr:cAMP-dependent protein kinase catalytic subunit beta-like [Maniola jurtina]